MSQANRRSHGEPGRQAGHAGSVILVIVLGAMCGIAGAAVQFRQGGGDLDQLAGRVESSFGQLLSASGGSEPSAKPGVKAVPRPPLKPAAKAPVVAAQPGNREPQPVAADSAKADPVRPSTPVARPVEKPTRAMRESEPPEKPAVAAPPASKPMPVSGPVANDTTPLSLSSLPAARRDLFQSLVNEANACYDKAVEHLQRSDAGKNPAHWQKENNLALDLLIQACNKYNQALEIYAYPSLLSRVQDTNYKRFFCAMRQIDK